MRALLARLWRWLWGRQEVEVPPKPKPAKPVGTLPITDWLPVLSWEPAPEGYKPVRYGSVSPPVVKLQDGRLIVDQCRMGDGTYEVKIFDNTDHPEIGTLPVNAPRAVKQIYRREWRLKVVRSTDALPILRDINAAETAWSRYCGEMS